MDANPLVYATTENPRRERCLELLAAVAAGRLKARTAVNVIEELLHLELRGRPPGLHGAAERFSQLFTPLLDVTDDIIGEALTIDAPKLGSNDRVIVATGRAAGISTILTGDAGFDSVPGIQRVDPLDADAVAALLAP
ncbi:MAG: type II toxin-antitoxin system VapC family toxin [Egibacteraceae bacterium]